MPTQEAIHEETQPDTLEAVEKSKVEKIEEENTERKIVWTPSETTSCDSFSVDWPSMSTDRLPDHTITSSLPPLPSPKSHMGFREKEESRTPVEKEQEVPVDHTAQRLHSACHYWAGRQQELTASQNDLRSRIRSQRAEILRIRVRIPMKNIVSLYAHL